MLSPQTKIVNLNNTWSYNHDKIQYLLNIHAEQGNKNEMFPFDLHIMILNKWFSDEQESYVPIYDYDDTFESFRTKNLNKIKNKRFEIHERLQYLLNIHTDKTKPFPVDLSFYLNLNVSDLIESYKYDKNYEYERQMKSFFYNGPTAYFEFLFKDKYEKNSIYSFYDCENDESETKFNVIKKFSNDFKPTPTLYLLWKSVNYDENYNYNRSLNEENYNPEFYLPENEVEEEVQYSKYEEVNNEDEPNFELFKFISV